MRSALALLLIGCALFPEAAFGRLPIYIYRAPPTSSPTSSPSYQPSARPSSHPTISPSSSPSYQPSSSPSSRPSLRPSLQPTSNPSSQPTAGASLMFQKSEAMAKPSSFGLWLTISLVGILLCFVFIGFQWFRKSRRQDSGHQQNTQGKRQDKRQDKKEDKQVVARSRSHRKKPDYLPHQISLRSKKQNTQNTLPPASAPAEEDEEDGWASAVGGMFSSFVSSLPTRLEELSVASSNPDVNQSPLSLFSCSDIQVSPAATPPRNKDYKKSNHRGEGGDKGRVKEHRHRDRRTDDVSAGRPPRQPKVHDKYDVDDSKRSRRRDDRKSKSEQQQSRSHKDKGSSSKKNAPPKPKGPDAAQLVQQRTKELDDAVTEAISGLSLFGHQKKEIVENTSKKVGDSASNTADAIGEKSADPSGRLDNRVAQVNGPTFVHNNNLNHPGYSSSKYDVPPPQLPHRSGSGYSSSKYDVPPPQLPHQGGPGQGHSFGNYGVPTPPQHPYQGGPGPGHSFGNYGVPPPQQPPQSCPPVSHTPAPQQGVRKDPAVSVNQILPSNKDVEELKRREVEEERDGIVTGKDGNDSKNELQRQRDPKRNDDGLDKSGMSGQNRRDRKHSRPDGRHADDKKRKGGRSAVHKFLNDDNDDSSSNSLLSSTNSERAGTAQTGNWGLGWFSNSSPQGGTGSIAESASTESGGSSTTSGASSGDDSASASLVPQDESVSSDSSASTSSDEDDDEESTLFSESDVE
eukprot:scaffold10013_cov79-Skeletonema_dohrnii-CCMP3373.AAC.11